MQERPVRLASLVTLLCLATAGPAMGKPTGLPAPSTEPPIVQGGGPGTKPTWIALAHQPAFAPGSMVLLTDGRVLLHNDDSDEWAALTPDRHGSYIHGTWRRTARLPGGYQPMYFASAVLADGRVVVLGGEYDGGDAQVESNRGAVYDPVDNRWETVAPPTGWTAVGDAQSTLLADAHSLLVADLSGTGAALLDTQAFTWSATGAGKRDGNNEEGFSLLPDGRVLTVDTTDQRSELYDPVSGSWSSGPAIPVQLVNGEAEQGPLVSAPDGSVLAVGATGHTAIYESAPGEAGAWTVGPDLPVIFHRQYVADDAAGARLPNGDALIAASPPGYKAPVHFFRLHGRKLTLLSDNETARDASSYLTRMLVLPTGDVLYDDQQQVYVFRSTGRPDPSWRPAIATIGRRLTRGAPHRLSGWQLAGRDQGAAYGDDFQDNTNYPLVRVVHLASKTVTYARTFGWSSVSTAPGARSLTSFVLPKRTPPGPSRLVVVANGIASKPVTVTVRAR